MKALALWKKWLHSSVLIVLVFSLLIPTAWAKVAPPTINPISSPLDADKVIISGTTKPDFKIYVTGGSYQISPVYADETGYFEITVALTQESTNNFFVNAENPKTEEYSESVHVEIIENAEAAAEAESSGGGGDYHAPSAPVVDEVPENIDADRYTFTGTGEADTSLRVKESDERTTVDAEGNFIISLKLNQNEVNNFSFYLVDGSGNVSSSTKVNIEEISQVTVTQNEDGDTEITSTDEDGDTTVIILTDIYGHWAEDYIVEMVSLGYMKGYDDNTFKPDQSMTRAEVTKTILEALAFDISDNVTETSFKDVKVTDWFATYVEMAKEEKIIEGYDDETFRPNTTITRPEVVKILLEASGVEIETPTESPFTDVTLEDWFAPYVMTAHDLGLVSGYDDGSFGIQNPMTRGEVTKVVMELMAQL